MPERTKLPQKVAALRAFVAQHRRMPGYTEMLALFQFASKNAVHGLLRRLAEQGYITLERGHAAPTGKLTGWVRWLGTVPAGFPSPAEDELLDTISLNEFLIERPNATFMLKVTGDSMIDAGIHPGDMVLVEKGRPPRNHDIVIAEVDGEWTMKYFVRDGADVRLEPANAQYGTIRPRQSLQVAGVVRTVIRKYE